MRAPGFWFRPPGLAAALLAPAAAVYARVAATRLAGGAGAVVGMPPVPVLCVGNLVAGGAGKTPVVRDLAARLRGQGWMVHTLSRGYGGRARGPLRVDALAHDAALVGDEPLLLARDGPAWVARDRGAGARAAAAAGAGLLILDDGFQNPALVKHLSLVVADGGSGFGNGRVIPAGPLREPVAAGLARAAAVVVLGADRTGIAAAVAGRVPVLQAVLAPDSQTVASLDRRPVLAFAGIGRPEKFFATCRDAGLALAATRAFPDHHPYGAAEVARLLTDAAALGAVPLTTEKDAMRLPLAVRARVAVLPVRVVWNDPAALAALLATVPFR